MALSAKRKILGLLQPKSGGNRGLRWVSWFLIVLIVLNVVAVILETLDPVRRQYGAWFSVFEVFSIAVFTLEYALRVWASDADPRYRGAIRGRLRYMASPMALADLAAILPFYLPLGQRYDLRILRALRLFRVLRLVKLGRYLGALRLIFRVLRAKQAELVATFLVLAVMLVISAALMYFAEGPSQPERFSNILDSLWWTMVILTKGTAELRLETVMGKVIASVISLIGVGFFALPSGILSSGLVEAMERRRELAKKRAPQPPGS